MDDATFKPSERVQFHPRKQVTELLQMLAHGLLGAIAIAPVAVAFAVVYVPTRVFHFSVGAVYSLVPYVALALLRSGFPVSAAFAVAVAAGLVVSVLFEVGNHGPLERKGVAPLGHFIASLGAYTVVTQIVVIAWGPDPLALRTEAHATMQFGLFRFSAGQAISGIVAIVSLACFYCWLPATGSGLKLRALASNPTEVALRGLNVTRLRLLAFGISGLLCSAAALASAWDVGFDPYSGLNPTLLAIVAAAIGGRHSFWGPLVGILLVGVLRALVLLVLSAQWQDAVAFMVLALCLYARPGGILSPRIREGAFS